jgi:polyhydroxyalkanoate synthesis regulator phasin
LICDQKNASISADQTPGILFAAHLQRQKAENVMIRNPAYLLALTGLLVLSVGSLRADDNTLLDVLVKKGVLTDKEAGKLGSEITKNSASQSGLAGNLKTGDQGQISALSGDIRFENYLHKYSPQLPASPVTTFDKNVQQFRLRLDADFKLPDKFFGGVQLSTSK